MDVTATRTHTAIATLVNLYHGYKSDHCIVLHQIKGGGGGGGREKKKKKRERKKEKRKKRDG